MAVSGLPLRPTLLAAVGGDGLLEIDSNINPLREDLFAPEINKCGKIDIGGTQLVSALAINTTKISSTVQFKNDINGHGELKK